MLRNVGTKTQANRETGHAESNPRSIPLDRDDVMVGGADESPSYTPLISGLDKAQALRQAHLHVMEAYPHPRYWAAFELIGDWR